MLETLIQLPSQIAYSSRVLKVSSHLGSPNLLVQIRNETNETISISLLRNDLIDAVAEVERFEEPWTGRRYERGTYHEIIVLSEPDEINRVAAQTISQSGRVTEVNVFDTGQVHEWKRLA